jgi:hypothetical protein
VVSRDKPVKRSAQDDDFVGVLKKNIPSKLALIMRASLLRMGAWATGP